MTSRDFVYWLQGFSEISKVAPTEEQWKVIQSHLNLVFKHEIDPSMPDPSGKLQQAHDGKPTGTTPDKPDVPFHTNLARC